MRVTLWFGIALLTLGCGGDVDGDGDGSASGGTAGASAAAGFGGSGGADAGTGGASGGSSGSAGAPDGGWTECSTPDFAACGVPECPEGRPGCTLCLPSKQPGLYGVCAENLDPSTPSLKPKDGDILLSLQGPVSPKSGFLEVPFSAGVFLSAHAQGDRVAYADRGLWTGEPLPTPTTCPEPPDARHCGGYCGGCPAGEICTGRSPLHPYGACIPKKANLCSRNPDVKDGGACSPGDRCFIFTVEPDAQPTADAHGFCVPQALCEAYAAHLPGGVQCK